jgi:radical SAM protein with 4Fe4S-binding SPASM domain
MAQGAAEAATVLSRSPHVVTWELTRACPLHCRHCRATAIPHREPGELTLGQIDQVLRDLAQFQPRPVLVFTGGDPTMREDLTAILERSVALGFHTAVAPSVTPRLLPAVLREWKEIGVRSVSLSLDGWKPETHDSYRGVKGTFQRTIEVAAFVRELGLGLQINTSVGPRTVDELPDMGDLVRTLDATSWEVFFVIPTGRARPDEALSPGAAEIVLNWLARYRLTAPFRVTVVGAPQFRRVLEQQNQAVPPFPAIREARGFLFISRTGEAYPSGYLPVSAGNVLTDFVVRLYQASDLFQKLRDPAQLQGRCRACEFNAACGGSRARAYAVYGDVLAEDPACAFA